MESISFDFFPPRLDPRPSKKGFDTLRRCFDTRSLADTDVDPISVASRPIDIASVAV